MFGLIVSGRPVQTNFESIGTNFVITIPDADNVNHIVVFMTGQQAFPDDMAALIYFSWPSPYAPPGWVLLGAVSNDKPTCVFKVAGLKKDAETGSGQGFMLGQQTSHLAQIGIAVEHINVVRQNMAMLEQQRANQLTRYIEFCQRMIENCFNYLSSFAVTQAQMTPNPTEAFVPLSAIQTWYQNFERRFAINPNFWQN